MSAQQPSKRRRTGMVMLDVPPKTPLRRQDRFMSVAEVLALVVLAAALCGGCGRRPASTGPSAAEPGRAAGSGQPATPSPSPATKPKRREPKLETIVADGTVFDVERLAKVWKGSGPVAAGPGSAPQGMKQAGVIVGHDNGLKEGVRLSDIMARYGEPQTSQTPAGTPDYSYDGGRVVLSADGEGVVTMVVLLAKP